MLVLNYIVEPGVFWTCKMSLDQMMAQSKPWLETKKYMICKRSMQLGPHGPRC